MAGGVAGAVMGLFFFSEEWLGGYGSWPRRMVRLAHISFFGIGFLNLAFGMTLRVFHLQGALAVPSALLIVGAVLMPAVCYLSAWRPVFRHLFFIPAMSVIVGVGCILARLVLG